MRFRAGSTVHIFPVYLFGLLVDHETLLVLLALRPAVAPRAQRYYSARSSAKRFAGFGPMMPSDVCDVSRVTREASVSR